MTGVEDRIAVVAAVIRQDGRYLVCRRPPNKRHGGLWEFPGGKVLAGETRFEAVRRELSEELELDASDVGEVLMAVADAGSPFLIEFVATVAVGTPVLHEHTEVGWFTPGELQDLPLAPADRRFADSLRRRS